MSALGEVKASRLAFFSEKNVWDLLLSDPVIDFDADDSDTVIEVDKIFFKMISSKNRNLNLFIEYDKEQQNHYTSTFFLEQIRDRYRKRESGGEQPILNILLRRKINKLYMPEIIQKNIRKHKGIILPHSLTYGTCHSDRCSEVIT